MATKKPVARVATKSNKISSKPQKLVQKSKSKLWGIIIAVVIFASAGGYAVFKSFAATTEIFRNTNIVVYACKRDGKVLTSSYGHKSMNVNMYAVRLNSRITELIGTNSGGINTLSTYTNVFNGFGVSNVIGSNVYTTNPNGTPGRYYGGYKMGGGNVSIEGRVGPASLPMCNGFGI